MRRWRGRSVALTTIGLCVGAFAVVSLARQAGGDIGIATATGEQLLTALANAAELAPATPLETTPADGTTADTARRAFTVTALGSARRAVTDACFAQGLQMPSPADQQLMPDIVCQGRWHDHDVTVHLAGDCRAGCRVVLETRLI